MGTVLPAREVTIRPRVSGEVVRVSQDFVPGGHFREGQEFLEIDPVDYELDLKQREAEVAQIQSDFSIEYGQQSVAAHEFKLLGDIVAEEDRNLVLRKPQLEKLQATLKSAQAALERAQLDLVRTKVKAPFNALVRTRDVNLGMYVSPTSTLTTLTGTDTYWVEVAVPVDQLRWIRIPDSSGENGSTVRVFDEVSWEPGAGRTGSVIRLLSDLETQGRMARLLVAVADPLSLEEANSGMPQMILDQYVRVEIEGISLDSVAAVERRLFRDGDNLWVLNDRGQLEIRPVEIAFRGRDRMFVRSGVLDGERLVVTDLPAAVNGMPLKVQGGSEPSAISAVAGDRNGRS
jgi:RND family efflux transporter MFP subunit